MPKSVYVPYTQRRHEELMTAQRKMSRGKIMEGNFESLLAVETAAQQWVKLMIQQQQLIHKELEEQTNHKEVDSRC